MGKMKNENFKRKNGWIDGSYRLLVHGHSLRFSCWWCGTVWGKKTTFLGITKQIHMYNNLHV